MTELDEATRAKLARQVSEVIAAHMPQPAVPLPSVASLAELAEMVRQMTPPLPEARAVMHPAAEMALRWLCADWDAGDCLPREWPSGPLLGSVPVIVSPDLPYGAWQIWVGDEMTESGIIGPTGILPCRCASVPGGWVTIGCDLHSSAC